jgi:hypothetical protein|tara:strand:+ start:2200 stop:2688 length:489 start_codon:yes stop_codon:yes gene_type:complete
MKKFLPILLLFSAPVYADMTHSISSSVKFESLSAATSADKIGSSYSISGNNVTTTDSNSAATIGGFGDATNGVPSISFPSSVVQASSGEAFSFSTSYLEGDATSGSAPTVGTVSNFSDLTSTSAGSVGTAAVALDNHTMTLTPGTGTGIVLTGQFVVDLKIE